MPYKDPKKATASTQRWLAKGDNRERRREYGRRYAAEHKEELQAKNREYIRRIKLETLDHYGRVCSCCGEGETAFLSIDHIDGGGNLHRKTVGKKGWGFYIWLRDNGYPEGYQVLCMNCQFGKQLLGTCPHQAKKLAVVA